MKGAALRPVFNGRLDLGRGRAQTRLLPADCPASSPSIRCSSFGSGCRRGASLALEGGRCRRVHRRPVTSLRCCRWGNPRPDDRAGGRRWYADHPGSGSNRRSGRSLADVRRSVEERLQAVNRNVPAVRLASPRQFVHVSRRSASRRYRSSRSHGATFEDAYNSMQGLQPNVRNEQDGALLSVSSERPQLRRDFAPRSVM